jgi:GPI-anchor transamidase subunit U
MNAVGQTTTVFSNLFLAMTLYGTSKNMKLLSLISLALETQKNFYPVILIVPVALMLSEGSKSKKRSFILYTALFIGIFSGLQYLNYHLMGSSWGFFDSTYAFIMSCKDLTPSIGIFWYFFTEMFDHFRELFLYTFQFNTTILYLIPLSLIFKNEPEFLFAILLSLTTIFRSYPCIGDICFYLSLIPLWSRFSSFMAHNFIVISTFIITSVLGPVVYYLWIYENSANANFFFGVTLVFCTANIFLVTDMIFSSLKRKFCLENGTIFDVNLKLLLE